MKINFSKMQGLGNDFMVVNNLQLGWQPTAEQICSLADRHFGVGFDQLLLIETPGAGSEADFAYRIFNADGAEVEQCGNGLRCFARYVYDHRLTNKNTLTVETRSGQYQPSLLADGNVKVDMGRPQFAPAQIPFTAPQQQLDYQLELDQRSVKVAVLSMGNPHAVTQVDDLQTAPVEQLGAQISNHPLFPNGVNAGFMQIIDRNHIQLRVYERGAGETLACGSGACAAVVAANRWGLVDTEVEVQLRGGALAILWHGDEVKMAGPAVEVFQGVIDL